MGLYSAEQARRCYQFCINRSTLTSHSFSTKNLQTVSATSTNIHIELSAIATAVNVRGYRTGYVFEIVLLQWNAMYNVYYNVINKM